MLGRLIRSVRQKPKHIRDQYALWTAVTVTGLVVVVWMFGLGERMNPDVTANQPESEGIFSSFFNEAGGRLSDVTESISDVTQPEETAVEVPVSTTTSQPLDMEAIFATGTPATVPPARAVRIATTTASTTQ